MCTPTLGFLEGPFLKTGLLGRGLLNLRPRWRKPMKTSRHSGPKLLVWNQYMLSYMDCDLSYLRSESDAALTPMLKLQLL